MLAPENSLGVRLFRLQLLQDSICNRLRIDTLLFEKKNDKYIRDGNVY